MGSLVFVTNTTSDERCVASDPSHPVEGGSANDYDYALADPCNNFDLDGRNVDVRRVNCPKGYGVVGTFSGFGGGGASLNTRNSATARAGFLRRTRTYTWRTQISVVGLNARPTTYNFAISNPDSRVSITHIEIAAKVGIVLFNSYRCVKNPSVGRRDFA